MPTANRTFSGKSNVKILKTKTKNVCSNKIFSAKPMGVLQWCQKCLQHSAHKFEWWFQKSEPRSEIFFLKIVWTDVSQLFSIKKKKTNLWLTVDEKILVRIYFKVSDLAAIFVNSISSTTMNIKIREVILKTPGSVSYLHTNCNATCSPHYPRIVNTCLTNLHLNSLWFTHTNVRKKKQKKFLLFLHSAFLRFWLYFPLHYLKYLID